MNSISEIRLRACMDELAAATRWIEDCCGQLGLSSGDVLRLTLIVEELFTNTVGHGHGGDCDSPVHVALRAEPTEIVLDYADTAPAFDALERAQVLQAEVLADADERGVGGLGLVLVASMAARAGYLRHEGWNRLQLVLLRESDPAA